VQNQSDIKQRKKNQDKFATRKCSFLTIFDYITNKPLEKLAAKKGCLA